jgi:hypothetical protein
MACYLKHAIFYYTFDPMKIQAFNYRNHFLTFCFLSAFSAVFALLISGCGNSQAKGVYGEDFTTENVLTADAFLDEMNQVDTLEVQVTGTIQAVCKHEGCWILIESAQGEKIYINTLDKAYKLPPSVVGKTAIAKGVGLSVKKQIEIALSNGENPSDLTWIKAPSIEASGIKVTQ